MLAQRALSFYRSYVSFYRSYPQFSRSFVSFNDSYLLFISTIRRRWRKCKPSRFFTLDRWWWWAKDEGQRFEQTCP